MSLLNSSLFAGKVGSAAVGVGLQTDPVTQSASTALAGGILKGATSVSDPSSISSTAQPINGPTASGTIAQQMNSNNAATTAAPSSSSLLTTLAGLLLPVDLFTGLVGLILLLGGIFLLRSTQNVISAGVGVVKKGKAVAALAA